MDSVSVQSMACEECLKSLRRPFKRKPRFHFWNRGSLAFTFTRFTLVTSELSGSSLVLPLFQPSRQRKLRDTLASSLPTGNLPFFTNLISFQSLLRFGGNRFRPTEVRTRNPANSILRNSWPLPIQKR
jgi:hypothetical protein